jgi:hypothetical protein
MSDRNGDFMATRDSAGTVDRTVASLSHYILGWERRIRRATLDALDRSSLKAKGDSHLIGNLWRRMTGIRDLPRISGAGKRLVFETNSRPEKIASGKFRSQLHPTMSTPYFYDWNFLVGFEELEVFLIWVDK